MKMMKYLSLALVLGLLWAGCAKNSDPSATSAVSVSMSASTTNGKTTIGGREAAAVTLTEVKVNVRSIQFDFDHEDEHFKKDSAFKDDKDARLKGPFIVDLLNAGSFVDQVVTSTTLPNGKYEKVSFRLAPSTEAGDMNGKSILITGTTGTTPFVFWHNINAKFGVKFNDSTALATSGAGVNLAIHLEMDRILSATNGGFDFSQAKDGNGDGTITIDAINTDGNRDLANKLMKLVLLRTHCEKRKK
ncbi:MAG: DUF4382 domain-containing protein [Cyclobacteriaceae bacterium]